MYTPHLLKGLIESARAVDSFLKGIISELLAALGGARMGVRALSSGLCAGTGKVNRGVIWETGLRCGEVDRNFKGT